MCGLFVKLPDFTLSAIRFTAFAEPQAGRLLVETPPLDYFPNAFSQNASKVKHCTSVQEYHDVIPSRVNAPDKPSQHHLYQADSGATCLEEGSQQRLPELPSAKMGLTG